MGGIPPLRVHQKAHAGNAGGLSRRSRSHTRMALNRRPRPPALPASIDVTQPDLVVLGNHRVGAGEVEIHDKETDIFYVIDGSATFVTGGTIVGARTTAPGQIRGTT